MHFKSRLANRWTQKPIMSGITAHASLKQSGGHIQKSQSYELL